MTDSSLCDGRVVVVTGAGRGLGRAHAILLAEQGARVVVNDLGTAADGTGRSTGPAAEVVEEIRRSGGDAISDTSDIADFDAAKGLVKRALDAFGRLDVVVNNAGFLRDRMFVATSEGEWDAVMRVHLKGHFAVTRHAAEYWRKQAKAGRPVAARIINTSSGAGLRGSVGQAAYSAAKAGIAALTLVQAAELEGYGVTANAIAPAARTRMTDTVFSEMMKPPAAGFDAMDPMSVSPIVAWLASVDSNDVTGRLFEVSGGSISLADGWRSGPVIDRAARWNATEVGDAVRGLIGQGAAAEPVYGARNSQIEVRTEAREASSSLA